jgi:mannan endo-1,4-beta-mannosidase
VDEVSQYIKSIDKNHLVATGDEGFFCERYQTCPDVTCDCYYGVDTLAFSNLSTVDFVSLHLYPGSWGKTVDWATQYIANHSDIIGKAVNKPVMLGEYGFTQNQHETYQTWTDLVFSSSGMSDLFWMISGREDQGWYPNYDGFAVYCPNTTAQPQPQMTDPLTCGVLQQHAERMKGAAKLV